MKYKEIYTLTRPSTDVPFHAPNSILKCDTSPLDPTGASPAAQRFTEYYTNTGKGEILSPPSLSDDGLTLTYQTQFNSTEFFSEICADSFFTDDIPVRQNWNTENNIIESSDVTEIPE